MELCKKHQNFAGNHDLTKQRIFDEWVWNIHSLSTWAYAEITAYFLQKTF